MKKQKVVIVGGGFGGVKAALELSKDDRFNITLISDRDTFRYYPTLYHTATGGLKRQSSISLQELFAEKSVSIVLGEAATIDRKAHTITLKDNRSYRYDTAILGLGVTTNYFGIPGMQEYSYSIKSIEEAERFKQHVHKQLADEHQPDPHYVIVGAGPTGIELAGALPQYIREVMAKHDIRHRAVHVDLIEAAPRLLPRMPKDYSRAVAKRLRRLGVKLYTGQAVQGLAADSLTVSGKPIRSHTVIWTAGVTNHPFFKDNGFTLTNRGKVTTDMYLQADDNVYVIGDNANTPYSGMAQTALYDGAYVARNLIRKMSFRPARVGLPSCGAIPTSTVGWAGHCARLQITSVSVIINHGGKPPSNGRPNSAMKKVVRFASAPKPLKQPLPPSNFTSDKL
jgi:NADH dehydrogenase